MSKIINSNYFCPRHATNLDHGADYSLKNRTAITILDISVNQIIEMLGKIAPRYQHHLKYIYSMNN
jgi:hypothetical protein